MTTMFKVDGVAYPVVVEPGGLKRKAAVLDGENAGRAKSGKMIRDVIGTYYNYTLNLDTRGLDVDTYDALYEVLSAPVDEKISQAPFCGHAGLGAVDCHLRGCGRPRHECERGRPRPGRLRH